MKVDINPWEKRNEACLYVHWLDQIEDAREKIDVAIKLIGRGQNADALPNIKEAIRLLQASISR